METPGTTTTVVHGNDRTPLNMFSMSWTALFLTTILTQNERELGTVLLSRLFLARTIPHLGVSRDLPSLSPVPLSFATMDAIRVEDYLDVNSVHLTGICGIAGSSIDGAGSDGSDGSGLFFAVFQNIVPDENETAGRAVTRSTKDILGYRGQLSRLAFHRIILG